MLLAIGNTLASVAGVLAPIAVGEFVAAPNNDALHWRYAFYLASALALAGFVLYVWLFSAEPLPFWRDKGAAGDPKAPEAGDEGEDEAETKGLVV